VAGGPRSGTARSLRRLGSRFERPWRLRGRRPDPPRYSRCIVRWDCRHATCPSLPQGRPLRAISVTFRIQEGARNYDAGVTSVGPRGLPDRGIPWIRVRRASETVRNSPAGSPDPSGRRQHRFLFPVAAIERGQRPRRKPSRARPQPRDLPAGARPSRPIAGSPGRGSAAPFSTAGRRGRWKAGHPRGARSCPTDRPVASILDRQPRNPVLLVRAGPGAAP